MPLVCVLGGKSGPSPLVLQLIEGIFGATPLPVEANQSINPIVYGARKDDVFGGLGFHWRHAVMRQDRLGIFCRFQILLFDEPSGYDHAALATPSAQAHFTLDALKSLTAIHPSALQLHQGDEVLDLHGLPQLKKIGDVSPRPKPQSSCSRSPKKIAQPVFIGLYGREEG